MAEREELIADITEQIARSEKYDEDENDASWGYETGVLLTRAEARMCLAALCWMTYGRASVPADHPREEATE